MVKTNWDRFWQLVGGAERLTNIGVLRERYGAELVDAYVAAGMESTASRWRAEAVRYTSPDFAIDIALNRDMRKLRQVIPWLDVLPRASGSIADLGCGEGLLTCFLAMLNPDVKVTGFDSTVEAAPAATEIASRLRLENVSFATADCLTGLEDLPGGPFGMATAFTFVAPALELSGPGDRGETSETREDSSFVDDLLGLRQRVPAAPPGLKGTVAPGGLLVTADRWSGAFPTWWAELVHSAGFRVLPDYFEPPLLPHRPLTCTVAEREENPGPAEPIFLIAIDGGLTAVGDGARVSFLIGDDSEQEVVALDLRDVSRLSKQLSRRHVNFTDRHGRLSVVRRAAESLSITAGSGSPAASLDAPQADELMRGLTKLLEVPRPSRSSNGRP